MKIVHVCLSGTYNDGWGYQENIISEYNANAGYDVTVIASKEGIIKCDIDYNDSRNIKYELNGVTIVRLSNAKYIPALLSKKFKLYHNLYKTIDDINPDILFFHGTIGFPLYIIPKYKKKHNNCRIFIDNHADYYNCMKNFISKYLFYKFLWKIQIKKTIPFVEKYFGTLPIRNRFMKEVYGIPEDKIELLVMGVNEKKLPSKPDLVRGQFRKKYSINDDAFVLIAGGKIDANKNFDKLIEAVNEVDNQNIILALFGKIENECKEIIESLFTERIKYIGWITPDEITEAFLSSELGVFPGLHSVLWEQAVSCGLPCIFHKLEGIDHVDINGNCILLADVSVSAIREKIEFLYNNHQEYMVMKEKADSAAEKMFYKNINMQFLNH